MSALSSEMFVFFFLSSLMFYLDLGLEFILHVDDFLVPVASFSLLLLLRPALSDPAASPLTPASVRWECIRGVPYPQQAFAESDGSRHPSMPTSTLSLNFSNMCVYFFQILTYLPFF